MNNKRLSRLKLIGIFAAFAGPVLIASILYFGQSWFEFDSTTERGNLLPSGQILDSEKFRLVKDGQTSDASGESLLDGRWLLLFHGTRACDLHCQASLFKMRQARLVLGRDAARVRTIYLLDEAQQPNSELDQLLLQYPALSVYRIEDITSVSAQAPGLRQNQVYIADPFGNLVMFYLPDAYSRDIIKDFKRLLKASKIG